MKQYIKNTLSLFLLLTGSALVAMQRPAAPASAPNAPAAPAELKLTDEEIKMLNLNETEAQELRQFFDALNNLTPAQKKELEDLGRATEEKMREKKLDPSNFDDLVKFMEDEGLAQPAQKPQPAKPQPRLPEPKAPVEKPKLVPLRSPKDTLSMLNDITKHIASLRQKAITRPYISGKLDSIHVELNELTFFIHLLKAPDLTELLTSKDFMKLHSNLEALHKALVTYEPSIIARKARLLDEPTPYEFLKVSETATNEEIAATYQTLEETKHPTIIEEMLKDEPLNEKERKTKLKAAQRSFDTITDAYASLKDPDQRALVDAELRKKRAQEAAHERASLRAFDKLFNALTTALYPDAMPRTIQQLLEKHKPQELALARAQLEREKKAYERSKQIVRVPQLPPSFGGFNNGGAPFHRNNYQRPPFGRPNGFGQARYTPPAKQAAPQPQQPKKAAQPVSAKKDENGKKDANGKEEVTDKNHAAAAKEAQKEAFEKGGALAQIADILEQAQQIEAAIKAAAQEQAITRGREPAAAEGEVQREAPAQQVPTLKGILEGTQAELTGQAPPAEPIRGITLPETPALLKKYTDALRLDTLAMLLKKVAPGSSKKIYDKTLKAQWRKLAEQHDSMIKKWDEIHATLAGQIKPDKAKEYNLAGEYPDPWKDLKKGGSPAADKADLGQLRHTINAIQTYVENMNEATKEAEVVLPKRTL